MPFFEPFVRTFFLGLSCGIFVETAHVLTTLASLANTSGTGNVWATMSLQGEASPLFFADHVVAFAVWMWLYAMECAGVWLLSTRGPKDLPNALEQFLIALPKRMLPLKLTLFRTLWLKTPYFRRAQPAGSQVSTQALAAAGTAVLERPAAAPAVAPLAPRVRAPAPTDAIIAAPAPRPGLKPGEWDPAQGDVARRETDRIARQAYLQNFWYCVQSAADATLPIGSLAETRVMGKSIALWRGADGAVRAISNICSHRGAQLAKGWLDTVDGEECVRCPYHAWAFNREGCVKHIPVQPDGRFPKRPLQESFATTVVDGNLWLFWGNRRIPEEERCPPPTSRVEEKADARSTFRSAEHLRPHWLTFDHLASEDRVLAIAAAFLGVSEASLSPADPAAPASNAFSSTVKRTLHVRGRRANLLHNGALPEAIPVTMTMHLPSSVTVAFDLGGGRELTLASHVTPLTYDTCSVHTTMTRSFAMWPGSNAVAQDALNTFVEGTRSRAEGVAPPKSWREPTDGLQRAFTNLRREYVSMGYGVPPEAALSHHRSDM